MDYKDIIPTIRGHYFDLTVQDMLSEEQLGKLRKDLWDMETAITNLLARAERAERERNAYKEMICKEKLCVFCENYTDLILDCVNRRRNRHGL